MLVPRSEHSCLTGPHTAMTVQGTGMVEAGIFTAFPVTFKYGLNTALLVLNLVSVMMTTNTVLRFLRQATMDLI